MNKPFSIINILLVFLFLAISVLITNCIKESDTIKYPYGTFPDTVVNLNGINSQYDDYNSTGFQLNGYLPLIFSSNRNSSGGQFDLNQGYVNFIFDMTDGSFMLQAGVGDDPFLKKLVDMATTPRNDYGPYRFYSKSEGYEYFVVASEKSDGNLDLSYFKNLPYYGTNVPSVEGPYPVKILNTDFDDTYLNFDLNIDTAYFSTNPEGNFDIYSKPRPSDKNVDEWFSMDYSASEKVDSINSPADDKCPMIFRNLMFFTSNRDSLNSGFDLYYSVFRNGKWNSPVNLGPKINSSSDEYRPLVGYHPDFNNIFIIFSSNRPGGKGGFDLYFTGFEIPK
jgi:hypothetical protein